MIKAISSEEALVEFVSSACEDEGICVDFNLEATDYTVIKLDIYYKSLKLAKTPASVDCLIIQKCSKGGFIIHLVELKNVESPSREDIPRKNLVDKFDTAIFDFMASKFRHIFVDNEYDIRYKLLLCAGKVKDDEIRSFSLEFLLGLKMFKYDGKLLAINGIAPHPTINPC